VESEYREYFTLDSITICAKLIALVLLASEQSKRDTIRDVPI